MKKNPESDPELIFEELWQTIANKYAYFELKNIDWDSVYTVFRPQVSPETDGRELFTLCAEMINLLRDGHSSLASHFNRSDDWAWFIGYPDNYDANLVLRHYLGPTTEQAEGLSTQIIDSVGYIYYGSFSSRFSNAALEAVLDRFKNLKGVIIDIRHNGGGSINNAFRLASAFIRQDQTAFIERHKSGPGSDEFSPARAYRISPHPKAYQGNVVVITNRRSYSASSFFAAMMKYNSHVTLLGDSTGGGGGLPVDKELSNGWIARFSASACLDRENQHIEPGVAPDVFVELQPSSVANNRDDLIEAALDLLNQ